MTDQGFISLFCHQKLFHFGRNVLKIMVLNESNGMFVMSPTKKEQSDNIDENLASKIEELTKLRKSISLDLKSIALATKISTHQLKNIEGLKFDKLPPHPMRQAFINQYCEQIKKAKRVI